MSHLSSQHLFDLPLRILKWNAQKGVWSCAFWPSTSCNLILHVLTICHEKPTQSTHCVGAKTFNLWSLSPALCNLWLLLVLKSCERIGLPGDWMPLIHFYWAVLSLTLDQNIRGFSLTWQWFLMSSCTIASGYLLKCWQQGAIFLGCHNQNKFSHQQLTHLLQR